MQLLTFTPCGILIFFTRRYIKVTVDDSSLKTIYAQWEDIYSGWTDFLKSTSPVAKQLMDNTVLGRRRPVEGAEWVAGIFSSLKIYESRDDHRYQHAQNLPIILLHEEHIGDTRVDFLEEICNILNVKSQRV